MDPRTLQMIQRGLIAAVSLVLALIVITSFMDLIQPQDETLRTTTTLAVTTEPETEDTTTTTLAVSVTTTTAGAAEPAICAEDEPDPDEGTILQIYLPCGSDDLAGGSFVYRTVAPTDLVLTATMTELTGGLDDGEADLGFNSPLPGSADGSFLGLTISDGIAYVSFANEDIFPPGASTAEGSQVFLSTLNANVFQFSTINAVQYRIGPSCDAFWQRLGEEECVEITRSQWQAQLASQ